MNNKVNTILQNQGRILILIGLFFLLIISCSFLNDKKSERISVKKGERWSKEKANDWYVNQPWIIGCNYVTSTAMNQIEMWQDGTFDPETIDKELGYAEGIGYNTVRIFFHNLVWEADPEGFKKRFTEFLDLCERHKIKAMVTFLTNGGRGIDPEVDELPEFKPGAHNSAWLQSPGATVVNDPSQWGRIEKYIKDLIGSYGKDERILLWDLYNEPENTRKGANSLPLLRKIFEWVREVNPSQPLTSCIMYMPCHKRTLLDVISFLGENCDVMSFHSYDEPAVIEEYIRLVKTFGRPILCTEYMARPKSTFEEILPILKRENIGAIDFGLVAGRCNFYFRFGSKEGTPEPEIWYHDVFHKDGTPYDPKETEFIKALTDDNPTFY